MRKVRAIPRKGKEPYFSFYKMLGFYPDRIELYHEALTHRSSSIRSKSGKWVNNERLEFLGDAILDAIVADILYKKFENKKEGFLTSTRSRIVQRETLNKIAIEIGIDKIITSSTRNLAHNTNIYGDALEALIGAIYLDGGFTNAKEFIKNNILNKVENKELFYDSKTILQEIVYNENSKQKIRYKLISEEGPDHNKSFTMALLIGNKQVSLGVGKTKKAAEQEAAMQAIKRLQNK